MLKRVDDLINNVLDLIVTAIRATMALLGMFATYEIIFSMDIPITVSALLIFTITVCAFFLVMEKPKKEAIPITVVPEHEAKPKMPKVEVG